jgi:acetyl-CoA carboxylase biotin carboxylase subunit
MIGKLIVHGIDRQTAIHRMRGALTEMLIEGIRTNIPLQRRIMADTAFRKGGAGIDYLEKKLSQK